MFMHIPLNHWKGSLGYGRNVFILIGIGLPLGIYACFQPVFSNAQAVWIT